MTCTSAKNFYFSSLANSSTLTAVSVSASSDGGQTFSAPVIAASASNSKDFFDADWMAVNPTNPRQLFVTYTDEDFSGTVCSAELGTSIKMVSSSDGGNTWSSPPVTVANEVCIDPSSSNGAIVEFSQVAVDPRGTAVYVAWESFSGGLDLPTREADIAGSALPLISFGSPVTISSVHYAGAFNPSPFPFGQPDGSVVDQVLQGRILAFERPILAIGKGPKNTGVLYVTWNDRDNEVVDAFSVSGFYHSRMCF
jgi:hypothetical protein